MDVNASEKKERLNRRESLLDYSVVSDLCGESLKRSSSTSSVTVGSKDCMHRVPKNTITFIAQVIVLYAIIGVSLYHLSAQSPNQELWLILLSSAFGYILPSPGLKYLKQAQLKSATYPTQGLSIDETDTGNGLDDRRENLN